MQLWQPIATTKAAFYGFIVWFGEIHFFSIGQENAGPGLRAADFETITARGVLPPLDNAAGRRGRGDKSRAYLGSKAALGQYRRKKT